MKTLYVLTEALFHTAYLVEKMAMNNRFDNLVFVIRNNNQLNSRALDELHTTHAGKTELSDDQLQHFNQAYGGLSEAEICMIREFGVPEKHCFSVSNLRVVSDFNDSALQSEILADKSFKCAAIFLDCILSDWWIDTFEQRIINAHSAVLPHARGMFAIEQYLLEATTTQVEAAAGATIHYVNSGIDKGNIIETKTLQNIWGKPSIWAVKAASYNAAFELLSHYCTKHNSFSLSDAESQKEFGPLFLAKQFTAQKRQQAASAFLAIKQSQGEAYGAA